MIAVGRVARLVYVLAALFAVTLIGTRVAILWREWHGALSRAETSAADTARIIEQYARRVFETSDLVLDLIIAEVVERGGPAAVGRDDQLHRRLIELSERMAGDYLSVFDARGVAVASNLSFPPPRTPLADRPWFRAHAAGADRVVGSAIVSRLTGEILFTYSRGIRDGERRLLGVAQVALRPLLFQEWSSIGGGLDGTVRGLWTSDGRPLARNGLSPADLGDSAEPAAVELHAPAGPYGRWQATGPADGRERLFAFRRLDDWGVVAAAGVPRDTALAPFQRDVGWSVGLLLAALTALLGLTTTARALDRREQVVRAELTAANASLRAARDSLETHVAERTGELAATTSRLRDSEARYRGIFHASFQLVALLAPDGAIIEANDATLAFAGLHQAEIVGHKLWAARWWDDPTELEPRLRDAVERAAAGEFVRFEAAVRGAGGRRTVIDFSLKAVPDDQGRPHWLVAEGRDIGALKAAQAQLHEAQKTETLGQLTGGVAHDFNNLLMAVLGNLSLLRKRLPDDPRLTRLIDGAVQGAQRGAALTQRLLAFARRQELRPVAVDLANLVNGMLGLLQRSLGPTAGIVLDVPADLAPVCVDPNQLELALLNLALNARDAMPQGGTVRIEAREVVPGDARPTTLGPARLIRIAVVDAGTGMDAATLARATEPFFTTKGPGRGSGLGLSMVHGLAAQSGGQLTIRSQPGQGTTVELWLPAAEIATAVPTPSPPAAVQRVAVPATGPLRILLVEDDPLIQTGTCAMLEDLGHGVVIAGSGSAGLEALREQSFALVLTDYAMPGMSGLEFAERARQLRPGLPIVLATGFAELPEAGHDSLRRLTKPYDQEALAAAIAAETAR